MNLPFAIERLRDVLRRQHKSLSTEASYVYWLRHYVTALKTIPGSLTSEQKLENFLTYLARHRDLAASTQNQAFNAILFFYSIDNGVSPRAIQQVMGHSSLETTMRYLHAESLSVRSPLETLMGGKLTPVQQPGGLEPPVGVPAHPQLG
jgi:site-specific recombinase XerD